MLNVKHYLLKRFQNISMQAILASNGIQTYLMFNYDQEQWSLKPLSYAPCAAGYSNQDKTGNIIADNHNFTTLNNGSNVNISKFDFVFKFLSQ
jgi:hypothetical protein